jgi:thiol-disulfide isomerase/thioredoxin
LCYTINFFNGHGFYGFAHPSKGCLRCAIPLSGAFSSVMRHEGYTLVVFYAVVHLWDVMKTVAYLLAAFSLCVLAASAEPPSTDQMLSQAEAKATAEHKVIFVHFGASWCGWCRHLDAFLDRPDIKTVFEKYFVPVKLVVQENEENKALENPGGEALLTKLGGPAGLPYSAFLDAHGGLIVNSIRPLIAGSGNNIGFPVQPEEVDWFVKMMRKAAPQMTDDDVQTIETALSSPKK